MKRGGYNEKLLYGMLICVISFSMTACNSDESESKTEIFAMDTYVTIEAFGENSEKAVSDAEQEIKRLENLWSVTDETVRFMQSITAAGSLFSSVMKRLN